ncbi:LPS-assembly lipoprotein LptE [Marinomonas aquimarina]|uniref:LPS-assembly lipoprotein LptE n=1 Tax=Marinomonas aquimarina TaxID=295068 RepID=A0A1A8T3H7_9GAMM|nr:LPS assembly lipoprotein LptE [Marinomonas aquimarina]SBS26378.1 LPS-assembly lipoprotein LptE [Marinomonas aquimarina]
MILQARTLWFIPVLLLTLLLSACGFQLRGQTQVPPQLQSLTLLLGTGSQDFDRDLRIALAQAGIRIVDSQPSAELHQLKVNPLELDDTVMARASDNDITQVERRIKATYFIRDEEGKALWGPRTVSISIMLNNQDAEQSLRSAYNAEQMQRASHQLADELVYDLNYATF